MEIILLHLINGLKLGGLMSVKVQQLAANEVQFPILKYIFWSFQSLILPRLQYHDGN